MDVGRDECFGRVNRAVDMAFRREMQHRIRLEVTEGRIHRPAFRDVGLQEMVARRSRHLSERLPASGIG